jgi:ketosteroid isomerase-like protein
MFKVWWLSAAGALLVACHSRETPQQAQARMEKESEVFTAAVVPIARQYSDWVRAGQADSIASIFTEQGREMPPEMPAVVGRAAIRAFEARNAATFASRIVIRGESYMASGPLGVERGSYTFEGKARPGAPRGVPSMVHDDGKYLLHWHNVNGQWLMADLIWNSNRRMMATGPTAKKKTVARATVRKTPKKRR